MGNIAAGIGLLIMAYSIVQHRLMDVSVFMAKGLSYILSLVILAIPSFFLVRLLDGYFHERIELSFVLILIVVGAAAILLFQVIIKRMDEAMHQIIVRDKYKYHEILNEFSRRLVTIVDLNRLLQMLADTIENSMGVTLISMFLHDPEKEIFNVALATGIRGPRSHQSE